MTYERRRSSRVEFCDSRARIRSAGCWVPVELVDASLTGARLCGEPLACTGERIELEIVVPCHMMRLRSTVVWSHRASSTFGVQFEALPEHHQVHVNNALLESWHGRPDQKRVLMVVGDPPTQTTLAGAIQARGYHVLSRSTPLDALQALETVPAPVDLAFISAALPNAGAYDLLDYLADEHPAVQRVLVVDRRRPLTLCRNAPDGMLLHPASTAEIGGVMDELMAARDWSQRGEQASRSAGRRSPAS